MNQLNKKKEEKQTHATEVEYSERLDKNQQNSRNPEESITRPLEKRERPKLTQDSAVWVLASEEDWELQ